MGEETLTLVPCPYHMAQRIDQATCQRDCSVPHIHASFCARSQCSSQFRLCPVCLSTNSRKPRLTEDPATGLCVEHRGSKVPEAFKQMGKPKSKEAGGAEKPRPAAPQPRHEPEGEPAMAPQAQSTAPQAPEGSGFRCHVTGRENVTEDECVDQCMNRLTNRWTCMKRRCQCPFRLCLKCVEQGYLEADARVEDPSNPESLCLAHRADPGMVRKPPVEDEEEERGTSEPVTEALAPLAREGVQPWMGDTPGNKSVGEGEPSKPEPSEGEGASEPHDPSSPANDEEEAEEEGYEQPDDDQTHHEPKTEKEEPSMATRQQLIKQVNDAENIIDRAEALQELVELMGSKSAASEACGKSSNYAWQVLPYLDLDEEVQEMIRREDLPATPTFKALHKLPKEEQLAEAKKMLRGDDPEDEGTEAENEPAEPAAPAAAEEAEEEHDEPDVLDRIHAARVAIGSFEELPLRDFASMQIPLPKLYEKAGELRDDLDNLMELIEQLGGKPAD